MLPSGLQLFTHDVASSSSINPKGFVRRKEYKRRISFAAEYRFQIISSGRWARILSVIIARCEWFLNRYRFFRNIFGAIGKIETLWRSLAALYLTAANGLEVVSFMIILSILSTSKHNIYLYSTCMGRYLLNYQLIRL